ncbi:C40 family peptidase [Stomatobaculum sp. F0698]|uniref:C40 family peptidase n=1 Tax=Stomatobaculum sp. F0698 TaxID=3059030 RepID=UPI00272A1436|nr:C40 family peptidase [Stomatobaculum sp. F0698]WLD86303.1 C40 family peptidase [Stomatobaculum sp. F0698]
MRKRIGVCAALALCVSIAASVPAFAAKDDAVMVEALNNESAEVNGIVPELHVEDAEASNSNGQGVVESAVVGDMKPAKPVGEPTGEEKTESLQNTSAAVIRKGASEKSETAKQQKSDDNAGPNGRIQAKLSGNSSDPVSAQTKTSGGAGRSVTDWSKVSKLRKSIVSYAKSLEGSRYVFGGVDPKSGIDCSGLILVVMRDKAGLDLDHYSASQATEGVAVSADQMRPGDIIAYDGQPRDGKVNHIAIYVGDGKAIHARGKNEGVQITAWDYAEPLAIRNLLGD